MAGCISAEPLSEIARIRNLTRQEAAERLPVKLRGVVTMAFPGDLGGFILDDGKNGIFVNRSRSGGDEDEVSGPLDVGMLVEIEGSTTGDGFARDVVVSSIRRIGTGSLPEAQPVRMDDLLGGHLDCQRVKVSGVIQYWDKRTSAPMLRMMMATTAGRKLPVLMMRFSEAEASALIDAEVEATGVATSFFNERGELIGVNVQVPDKASLKLLIPPPEVGRVPVLPLASLRPFSTKAPSLHRVKVKGTVSFSRPGEFFYVQEGDRAVRVNTRDERLLKPGDRVEILGYPEVRNYFAEMIGAEVERIGQGAMPPVEKVDRSRILRRWQPAESVGSLDGRRVEIDAKLEKIEVAGDGMLRLFLNHEGATVMAMLSVSGKDEEVPQVGSRVRVTGICVVELNTSWPGVDWAVPEDFHLLVQSPDDILVIRNAPWWTPVRIWSALAVIACAAGASVVWGMMLRRQVNAQTETIRMQSVRETLAEERSRMAREFHDTLEQELTGLAIQLDAASDSLPAHPDQAAKALENAYTLLSYTRTETRRSIWDLRAMALQEHGLFGALELIAEQLEDPGVPKIEMRCEGTARRLEARVETNLLRIGSECLTNAVKHARASKIGVTLVYEEEAVMLSVEDDGDGFDPVGARQVLHGHFGLRGMRERANQIGAMLEVDSSPGRGTKIVVRTGNPKG